MCTLYNLQTLSVHGCNELHKLPAEIGNLISLRHLDNASTTMLNEMPCGISKLTNLQTLSKFVVGKTNGSKLQELKDIMPQGSLSVQGLQNVNDSQDAKDANLKLKHGVDELELEWCGSHHAHLDEKLEYDVLEMLQPHTNLKKLKIRGYRCSKFSSWVGDPLFRKVVIVSLIDCRGCKSVPPFWQLPKLKHLTIDGMIKLRCMSFEFNNDGRSSEVPFQCLETLCFQNMPKWVEWSISTGGEEVWSLFPRLRELTITGCPKLIRIPLLRLPSLTHLVLKKCHEVVLRGISEVTSMIHLEIESVVGLSSLHDKFLQFCMALESLYIIHCTELVRLWPNGFKPHILVSLQMLWVNHCRKLVSLGEEEQGLPCNLERLTLIYCDNLKKLPNGMSNLVCLEWLHVQGCPQLVSVGEEEQCGLQYLILVDCDNLEKLANEMTSLLVLKIERCPKLLSFPRYI